MAIYHFDVKALSRSDGRSATAAAAYRSGTVITHDGETFDYSRKGGVLSANIILPEGSPEWATDREALWCAAENAETRKNSVVARDVVVALPAELDADQRQALAEDFGRYLADRHGVAVDVAVHAPNKAGDDRNYHAHLLLTTRRLTATGLGEKTRELNGKEGGETITAWREEWERMANAALKEHGHDVRIDCRSLAAKGIDREPNQHEGVAATNARRRGVPTCRKQYLDDLQAEQLVDAGEAQDIEEMETRLAALKAAQASMEQARAEIADRRAIEQAKEEARAAMRAYREAREAERAKEEAEELAKAKPEPARPAPARPPAFGNINKLVDEVIRQHSPAEPRARPAQQIRQDAEPVRRRPEPEPEPERDDGLSL